MLIGPRPHPLERLSWSERFRVVADRRRTRLGLDALQLRILRALAGRRAEVSAIGSPPGDSPRGGPARYGGWLAGSGVGQMRPVEVSVANRRLSGRVSAEAAESLRVAMGSGPVVLVDAGRYGPYWTLAFATPLEVLVVLADWVVLRPGPGGTAGDQRLPALRAGD